MDAFFEEVKFLTTFVGCAVFEKVAVKESHVFYAKGRDCDARGVYDPGGFTILEGSVVARVPAPSFSWKEKREKLLGGYTVLKGGKRVLLSNKTFSSPSTAAAFCLGRQSNGWTDWKDADGQSLDAVYRSQLD